MFRSIIFWSHLVVGVATGIVVFIMSISGVLLTYERQIVSLVERAFYVEPTAQMLSLDEISDRAIEHAGGAANLSLTFHNNVKAPVTFPLGCEGTVFMSPYTGDIVGEGGALKTKAFFGWMTQFHRWLALEGESRTVGKAIADASNLLFLFLVVTGIYIWFPKAMNWPAFRMIIFFKSGLPTSKARDFNWHHVLAFWMLIPIFLMVATAVVFSYGWANEMVYTAYGEEAPVGMGRGGAQVAAPRGLAAVTNTSIDRLSLDQLMDIAKDYEKDWNTIRMTVPSVTATIVNFAMDSGTGGEPTKQSTLSLNRGDGSIASISVFTDNSSGQQARTYIRRLHTGESHGFIGQTIAGLGSLAACFLVYTGFALSYRRLIQPLLKKRLARS